MSYYLNTVVFVDQVSRKSLCCEVAQEAGQKANQLNNVNLVVVSFLFNSLLCQKIRMFGRFLQLLLRFGIARNGCP